MKTLIILLFPFLLSAQSITDDKNMHYMAGVNISAGIGSLTYYYTKRPFISCLTGIGASLLAGWGKELIWDKGLHKGTYDVWDANTTGWGGLTGALGLRIGINIYHEKKVYLNYE